MANICNALSKTQFKSLAIWLNNENSWCDDYMACMDYMDPDVPCLEKAVKLDHLLTHSWC